MLARAYEADEGEGDYLPAGRHILSNAAHPVMHKLLQTPHEVPVRPAKKSLFARLFGSPEPAADAELLCQSPHQVPSRPFTDAIVEQPSHSVPTKLFTRELTKQVAHETPRRADKPPLARPQFTGYSTGLPDDPTDSPQFTGYDAGLPDDLAFSADDPQLADDSNAQFAGSDAHLTGHDKNVADPQFAGYDSDNTLVAEPQFSGYDAGLPDDDGQPTNKL